MHEKKILSSALAGATFMSRVLAKNPNPEKLDIRKIIDGTYPDNRDQLPERYGVAYPDLIRRTPAIADVDAIWYGKAVGIIGAGAAGLCAGYELMRCGLTPVFFEPQVVEDNKARPGGRAFSAPFDGLSDKKTVAEMGCMRFPKSHTTLRTYVDEIFRGEYKYEKEISTQWPPFFDPLLLNGNGEKPQPDWEVVYDTALYARGVNERQFYRANTGDTFSELPEAIQDVSLAFSDLLFNENTGILNGIVDAYAAGDIEEIQSAWATLVSQYQNRSIFEVLRDAGWDQVVAGTGGTSRLDIFGELGLGSGGFDAFWGTTFMEVLRIKLHGDESDQDAFCGGSSYMLKPFLTHKTVCADKRTKQLLELTDGHVVLSPVIAINKVSEGGVQIVCENGKKFLFPCVVLTVAPTAISSSIAIDEDLLGAPVWDGIRRMPLTGSGKIFAGFSKPFWKNSSQVYPGRDAIVTTVTDYDIRQVYTFDNYHWESGSPAGILMLSYTWGDWAHKMGSLSENEQVESAVRMLKIIYAAEWTSEWDAYFDTALKNGAVRTINWSHERGFAGGYRMANLDRYPEQLSMSIANNVPADYNSALLLAGEATAWLGLSGWVEGALHTGINSVFGVADWFTSSAYDFPNWENMTDPDSIKGTSFIPPSDPGDVPFNPQS